MRLTIAIAVFVAIPGLAVAAPIKVAVVPGVAVNLDSARVDALSQDLADALASELEVEAIGGLEVRRQLPAEGLPPDCLTTPTCVTDVAKRLGATQLLFVVMIDATGSGAVQVDSTWVDLASGTRTSRPAVDVPAIAEARTRFNSSARLLLPDAPIRPKPTTGIGGEMSPQIPRHFTPTTYAFAGAAVVGLGVGVAFGLSARSKFSDCEAVPCTQSEKDSIRTTTIIADAGFVVAAVGIVATGVLFATSGKESRLVVSPSPTGISLAAVGRF